MNKVIMIGHMACDPETRYTSGGKSVCTFRIAVNRRFVNAQGVREADFFPVVAWQSTGELVQKYLKKGDRMAVHGYLQSRSYDKDGQRRYITEIIADEVEFLNYRTGAADAPEQGGFTQVDDEELPF